MSETEVAGRRADLSLEVGADADDAPPGGHLECEADHPSDLQQGLLTQAPAALRTDKRSVVTSHLRRHSVQSADHCSTPTYEQRSAPFSPAHWTALTHLAASVCTFMCVSLSVRSGLGLLISTGSYAGMTGSTLGTTGRRSETTGSDI